MQFNLNVKLNRFVWRTRIVQACDMHIWAIKRASLVDTFWFILFQLTLNVSSAQILLVKRLCQVDVIAGGQFEVGLAKRFSIVRGQCDQVYSILAIQNVDAIEKITDLLFGCTPRQSPNSDDECIVLIVLMALRIVIDVVAKRFELSTSWNTNILNNNEYDSSAENVQAMEFRRYGT